MPTATMKRTRRRSATPAQPGGITPSMSDAAVEKATGKTWKRWFSILDKVGAKSMTHQQIVAHLVKHHGVGPWWRQMVTVTYEQARGLRAKHQTPHGFQISRSRTIAAPAERIFKAWTDAKLRGAWLDDPDFTIRKAIPGKSIRITWVDGTTNVEVMFYPKAAGKCSVSVQHNKLKTAASGERMKKYWGSQLEQLAELVE